MAKSLVSGVRLHEVSRIVSSANANAQRKTRKQPGLPNRVAVPLKLQSQSQSQTAKLKMETSEGEQQCRRIRLSDVVADCANRWFHDTLKEAKSGDPSMQLLVAQMYFNGYGVPRDPQKGNAWFNKASRSRNSAWKAIDKHIGYRTSDSDSFEQESKAKFSP